jgi:tetratricopeptide (TPR) repeat protein
MVGCQEIIMNTLVHQSDFSSELLELGQTLQSFFYDLPIRVECAVREERLIVLGQHSECADLNPAHILKILERKIQTFQLGFTQHVRVYLRVMGHVQPYAHRWFMIQPPPPPRPVFVHPPLSLEDSLGDSDDAPWTIDDEELDDLVQQLVSVPSTHHEFVAIAPDREALTTVPSENVIDSDIASSGVAISYATNNPHPTDTLLAEYVSHANTEDELGRDALHPEEANQTSLALPDLRTLSQPKRESEAYEVNVEEFDVEPSGLDERRSLQIQTRDKIHLLSRTVLTQFKPPNEAVLLPPFLKKSHTQVTAISLAFLGLAGITYGVTRPCVIGECSALAEAHELSEASVTILQDAESWPELELARDKLNQAVDLIDPIPMWSRYFAASTAQSNVYHQRIIDIEALLDVEALAQTAIKAEQTQPTTAGVDELKNIRAIWQDAIAILEAEPTTSDLYPMTLQQLPIYRQHAERLTQQIEHEQQAGQTLENAKQAAELARNRQQVARSLDQWKFARVTWIVALERLTDVPQETAAAQEVKQLMPQYQTALNHINQRIQREQRAVRILAQAEEKAQVAQAAEQRFDWQQAVQDWDRAIAYAQRVDHQTHYQLQAEALVEHYTSALDNAQEKLTLSEHIQTELNKTCIGEIRICNLLSVGATVAVQLDTDYIAAINAARESGNPQLQAVITDHQVILRRTLEQIAQDYQLLVEVFDTQNQLLGRHGEQHASDG